MGRMLRGGQIMPYVWLVRKWTKKSKNLNLKWYIMCLAIEKKKREIVLCFFGFEVLIVCQRIREGNGKENA